MNEKKTQERGSVMVEVIAVLALLGAMMPMVYRQISERSKELDNVNMASEIRVIADAVTAYLQADRSLLNANCPVTDETPTLCTTGIDFDRLCMFLPNGMCSASGGYGSLGDYEIVLYGYIQDQELMPRPVYQAFIVPQDNILPLDFNLKRASRVAMMIGTNGGLYTPTNAGEVTGTAGSWSFDLTDYSGLQNALNNLGGRTTYLAVATVNTFTPEIYVEEGAGSNKVHVPDNLAFARLHAWNFFSVGPTETGSNKCFTKNRTLDAEGNAISDTIHDPGATGCDPLFWVGTQNPGDASGSYKGGNVYAKNSLYIGHNLTDKRAAISLETNEGKDGNDSWSDDKKNKERRIVVYDVAGNEKVTIDGTGQVVADKFVNKRLDDAGNEIANLTIEDAQIKSDKIAESGVLNPSDGTKYHYALDPAGTSLMNDIRLDSRGGARLSDILPNYIAKGVYPLSTSDAYVETNVKKPTCPKDYVAAIIVTPTHFAAPTRVTEVKNVIQSKTLTDTEKQNLASALTADITSGTITPKAGQDITLNVNASTTNATDITHEDYRFAAKIGGNTSAFDGNNSLRSATGDYWKVELGYLKGTTDTFTKTGLTGKIEALAQTYCVYKNAFTSGEPNAADDDPSDEGLPKKETTTP